MSLWGYVRRNWAERGWKRWYSWAIRSRPAASNVTNARAEGINAKIQWIKKKANGYRNRESFRRAIYFHLGGLDLAPVSLTAHTKA